MSERPEWMPSHKDVEEQSDLHIGWVDDEAMDFLYHVGLRAQIAVLEEIIQFFSPDGLTLVEKDWLLHKVAALRKELGE